MSDPREEQLMAVVTKGGVSTTSAHGRRRAGTVFRLLPIALMIATSCPVSAAQDSPVRVSVVEIGESRVKTSRSMNTVRKFQGQLAVRFEVESSVDFTGRLETILRTTDDPAWQRVNVWPASSIEVDLDLDENRAEIIDLLFKPQARLGEFREISWRVVDPVGVAITTGEERAAQPEGAKGALDWALLMTAVHGDGRRRAPEDAFEAAFRYESYRTVVIESDDLVSLGDRQRKALLDAAAFGRSLVVCKDTAGLAQPIREVLARQDSLVWRGDDGAELREIPFVFGIIRHFSGSMDQLIGSPEPVRRLVDMGVTVEPGQIVHHTYPVVLWRHILSQQESAEGLEAAEWISLIVFIVAISVLLGLWIFARRARPVPLPVIVGLIAVACVVTPVGHQLLAHHPIGNNSQDSVSVWHDLYGTCQVRRTFTARGGGGGTTATKIDYRQGPEAMWFPLSTGTRWTTMVESPQRARIESTGVELARHKSLGLLGLYSKPVDPAWVGTAAFDDSGLSGRVRAGRDFESAVLVGYRGTAAIGAVRAGQELDLAEIKFKIGYQHLSPGDLNMITDSWEITSAFPWHHGFSAPWGHRARVLTETELMIIARDAESPDVIHVQPIKMTSVSRAPPAYLTAEVPSTDLGTGYRLYVPEKIFESWREGATVLPASIEFVVDDDLVSTRWNGFRVIEVEQSYRTTGDINQPYFELRWLGGYWS